MSYTVPSWREILSHEIEHSCTTQELISLQRLYRQAREAETAALARDRVCAMLKMLDPIVVRLIVHHMVAKASIQADRELLDEPSSQQFPLSPGSPPCPQNRSTDSEDDSIF